MIKLIIVAAACALVGCSSLRTKVDHDIHEGDSESAVREALGDPDEFHPSQSIPGGTIFQYERRGQGCRIGFDQSMHVVKKECIQLASGPARQVSIPPALSAGDYMNRGQCSGFAPMAPIGCHMACINGQWSTVCN